MTLIDANELRADVLNWENCPNTFFDMVIDNLMLRSEIKILREQLNQQLRHGHWIKDEDGNIRCSVCGNGSSNDNFCEHCGAKMEEQE